MVMALLHIISRPEVLFIALLYHSITSAFAPPHRPAASSYTYVHTVAQGASPYNNENNNTSLPTAAASPAFSTLRSIGVDYGVTRTGIAITTGGYHPQPLAILSGYLNSTQLSSTIVNYIVSEQATNIVLGLPLHKDGSDSEQSLITREFGQCLLQEVRKRCGTDISITLWDERYTSKAAETRIKAEAIARNQRIPSASDLETALDADAACIILEDYYKELGEGGEIVVLENEDVEIECDEIYLKNLELQEETRRRLIEEREKGRNVRQEMIARARAFENVAVGGGGSGDDGLRKKKKKKKKKK